MNQDFQTVQPLVNLNLEIIEQSQLIQYKKLHKDARDYLLSQMRRTVAVLGKILLDYGKK